MEIEIERGKDIASLRGMVKRVSKRKREGERERNNLRD